MNLEQEESEENRKKRKRANREMAIVTYIVLALFLVMSGFVGKFLFEDNGEILNNRYNKRQDLLAEQIVKGSILSADGKVLAETKTDKIGNEYRYYPYDGLFSHIVGRVENGKTGLEESEAYTMLTSNINPILGMIQDVKGEKNPGNHIVTTLNVNLQKAASEALGSQKGAVVVMEPDTGKILAMVSKPTYNPNTVSEDWNSLLEDSQEESALYNRATQGLYPPGSTFKLVTALAYMRQNEQYKSFHYNCKGYIGSGGDRIRCYGGKIHGHLDLALALEKSCNAAFGKIGTMLNIDEWENVCDALYFNRSIPFDLELKKASFTLKSFDAAGTVRQTAIGQGDTLVTPLQNIFLVCAAVNKGTLMSPYIIDHIEDDMGNVVRQNSPLVDSSPITEKEANQLVKWMEGVVSEGTAYALNSGSYHAGGKTGSAEFKKNSSDSHSWFVGFAEKNKKKLAVSIVVEGAGTGSEYAVPVAKRIFDAYW